MTYSEYKELLKSQGWYSVARYMGTGEETGCDMRNETTRYILTVSMKPGGVVACATVMIPGFMNPVTTGDFGSPWENKAFFVQVKRLERLYMRVGDLRDV